VPLADDLGWLGGVGSHVVSSFVSNAFTEAGGSGH
jgi:hypothetical protein